MWILNLDVISISNKPESPGFNIVWWEVFAIRKTNVSTSSMVYVTGADLNFYSLKVYSAAFNKIILQCFCRCNSNKKEKAVIIKQLLKNLYIPGYQYLLAIFKPVKFHLSKFLIFEFRINFRFVSAVVCVLK